MSEFRTLLRPLGLSPEQQDRLVLFYDLVVDENSRQNLTRLISPVDFLEGHVFDGFELLKTGVLDFPAMDLGSGVGVPGLLMAILGTGPWVLAESEGRKAEFLERAVRELGLKDVQVYGGRAEAYLKSKSVKTVVARAVGPVDRIWGWIGKCSTWNNLVLLKGPSWDEEWASFDKATRGRALRIDRKFGYEVGAEAKRRVVIRLARV